MQSGCFWPHSFGTSLDVLAAFWGVTRLVVHEGDPEARPPVPPSYESDEDFRRRTQLALEGQSTAGPEGSYTFWAFTASGRIKDVAVQAPEFYQPELSPSQRDGLPADAIVLVPLDDVGLDNPAPGDVAVTVLTSEGDGTPSQDILDAVETTLNHEDVRPLTDRPRVRPSRYQTLPGRGTSDFL